MSLTTELLRFVRRAGIERSATRILAEMSRFIAGSFDVHRVGVYVYEGTRLRPLVSEYASGETRPDLWSLFRKIEGLEEIPLARRLRAEQRPLLLTDPGEGFLPDQVETFQIQPFLAVPLYDEDSPLGLVLIEGDPAELRAQWEELVELAEFVALAVHNVRAFAREQQRAREAEALLEVATVLTEHTELTPVLAAVARNCARVTGFERASIFLVDDDGALVPTMSQFADGHLDHEAWATFRQPRGEVPACRRVLETGEPLAIEDADADPGLVGDEWREPFGLRSMLVLPLTAWGRRFGAMVLDHQEVRAITDEQVRIALGVAAHGAAAIGLARLLAAEREAKERLAELDRLKTAFVATVSHELRTPLTSIVGFTELLPDLVDGEAAEFVALMRRESLHLEALIANLLDSSRLEAGVLDIRREPVDVTAAVAEAVDLVAHLHPEVEVDAEVADGLRLEAGDAPRLRQVLVNLCENACKYGGGRARVAAGGDGDRVRIEVEDDGPGVPDDQRELVFERFHRVHEGQESGTGIGLYLVKALVEAHGGEVRIGDGDQLGGARFVVELPVAASRPPAVGAAAGSSAGSREDGG